MSNYCIINGNLKPIDQLSDSHIISGQSIYEVLRIINDKPAFFDEHVCRLSRSAALTGKLSPNFQSIYEGISLLIKNTEKKEGNIEITVNDKDNWCIKYIPHTYPTKEQYANGVKCKFYDALRENPNAKVKRVELREYVGDFIKENNIYEAIYENDGQISEGSKSNIFFIRNNQVVTPPKELVLPGITRQIVINIIIEQKLPILEKNISTKETTTFHAAFLTGTSPGILPISTIEQQKFDVNHPTLRMLMKSFEQKLAH
jgi:branched-chain amino acid aminotransferase